MHATLDSSGAPVEAEIEALIKRLVATGTVTATNYAKSLPGSKRAPTSGRAADMAAIFKLPPLPSRAAL